MNDSAAQSINPRVNSGSIKILALLAAVSLSGCAVTRRLTEVPTPDPIVPCSIQQQTPTTCCASDDGVKCK